jgi:cytosine/adenosine deaminase-related metal-dependent hydrolase
MSGSDPREPPIEGILAVDSADRRILIRGATVITMDPEVPDLEAGDILIAGTKIAGVGSNLRLVSQSAGAIVLNAEGMIAIPGLHDTHRHCWQGQLRLMGPNFSLDQYGAVVHELLAPYYRPQDIYAGTLISALSAIDSGVTCLGDFAHNLRSCTHADSAVKAFVDSGVRTVHASSGAFFGEWDRQWPDDMIRLKERWFSSPDGLTTLRLGVLGTRALGDSVALSAEKLAFARDLGLHVVADGIIGEESSVLIEELGEAGLLGPDVTFVHCSDISDAAWSIIASSKVRVSLAATSEAQLGIGAAIPPIQRALDHGVRPGLAIDSEVALSPDLFTQMRVLYCCQRMNAHNRRLRGIEPLPDLLNAQDVLEFATVWGAHTNGLLDKTGTLTPGKEADLVLLNPHNYQAVPVNNAIGTVVLAADARMVDTVLIAGKPRKYDGKLIGHDLADVRRLVETSRDYLYAETHRETAVLG